MTNSKIVNDRMILLTGIDGKKVVIDSRSIVMVEEVLGGTTIHAVNMGEGIVKTVREPLQSVVDAMTHLEQGLHEEVPDTSWVDNSQPE